ncbi:MAG TPA: CCA tRNA nucleotidyltransferase [Nitriliruptorales bacterium]|nr:CCA tRNA nucleotidyltransferase [Nitriliruptorales bacterium]
MTAAHAHPGEQAALRGVLDLYPEVRALGERFAAAGHQLYLVGGSVRDTLLQARALPDLDFATSARPEDTARLLHGWADHVWDIGARFGTISARKGDRTVEVTTFRSDAYAPGSRHPEVSFGDSIEADLSRRDFTVNAMAVQVPDVRFLDPFGGLQDLRAGVLRTPMDPAVSFGDDPLRMFRLARFVAVLGARPDPSTEQATARMAAAITSVAAERVRDELNKLLVGASAADGIDLLARTGLAAHVLPEVARLTTCVDPQQRHKDVYAHTLAVVEQCRDDLVLRLAALLHDIGKPDTRAIHPDGIVTFHHHEAVGARLARRRLRELRYDRQTVEDVADLVFLHLRFHTYKLGWSDSAVRRYVRDAGPLLSRLNELTRADVTTADARKRRRIMRRMNELEERIAALREQEELDRLRPALDGNQIMARLRIAPGPLVGAAWNHLLEVRVERGPMTEEEAYAELDRWWEERQQDDG